MRQSYEWILACIDSSTNSFQFKCCDALIELFEKKYTVEGKRQPNEVAELLKALIRQTAKHCIDV